MEFTFEEKFIFGNQNFIKCYFNAKFGSSAKSGCLIADKRGILYTPMISDSNKIYMHRLKLTDVRNKNLVIRCIHLVQHNKRSYVFLSCESIEGGAYCLITYCISNPEIYDGDNELLSWQILEVPFKIMDLQSLTDATGNSVIAICGSDKRLHIYSLDAQCIIRPKKKSNFLRDKVIEQLLISSEYPETFLASALPLRLYLCQDSISQSIHDALLGYSNGIVIWFHTILSVSAHENEHEIIQEIPLYHGSSIKPIRSANSESSNKPVPSTLRRNLSAGDLAKSGEFDFDSLYFDDSNLITSRNRESSPLEKPAVQEQQNQPHSESSKPPPKANVIENKTLLLDGIISCLCFYQVPLPVDLTAAVTVESKSKSLQWFAPKAKKQQSLPCVVFGLAGGGTLLACFEDSERPIAILPGPHKRGGVLAIALGNISSNVCQDIFFGFHDGTVTLVKYEDSPRPNCEISNSKLSKVYFSVMWEIQFTFPVMGLSFGQLLGLSNKQDISNLDCKVDQGNKAPKQKHSDADYSETISEILSDQLAVVTTKSFHLFSLSLGDAANMEKIAYIDRFVAQMAPLTV